MGSPTLAAPPRHARSGVGRPRRRRPQRDAADRPPADVQRQAPARLQQQEVARRQRQVFGV